MAAFLILIMLMIIYDKVVEYGFKLKFGYYGFKQAFAASFGPGQKAFLLGQSFPLETQADRNQLCQAFQRIIWITYTKNFKPLVSEERGVFTTDAGWGCMIRAGQMLLANWLIKLEFPPEEVISLFADDQGPLGIRAVAGSAQEQLQLHLGDWYSPSQIVYTLQSLLQHNLKLAPAFRMVVCNNSSVFFDQLLLQAGCEPCACYKKTGLPFCKQHMEFKNSLGVVVLSRIGLDQPQPKYLQTLELIFEWPSFSGTIGGRPRSALFFVGKNQHKLMYLDPHYVKPTISGESPYFPLGCSSLRELNSKGIDASLGVTFLVRSGEGLNELYRSLRQMREERYEDMFIYMELQTPQYMRQQYQPREEEYEVLP